MTTKQNDAVALTDEQLDAVAGGAAFIKIGDVQGGGLRMDKSSPKSRFRGCLPLRRC
jgi:hypothetical protein